MTVCILAGYFLGAIKFIPPNAASVIGKIYSQLLLPVTMFVYMAKTDLRSLRWDLILVLAVSKFIAGVITLGGVVVFPPESLSRLTRAGLMTITTTNSSIPIGIAILPGLYPELYPYLFIVNVLVDVLMINPICLVLLEAGKRRNLIARDFVSPSLIFQRELLRQQNGDHHDGPNNGATSSTPMPVPVAEPPRRELSISSSRRQPSIIEARAVSSTHEPNAAVQDSGHMPNRSMGSLPPPPSFEWKKYARIIRAIFCTPYVICAVAGSIASVSTGGVHDMVEASLIPMVNAMGWSGLFSLGLTLVGKVGVMAGKQLLWSLPIALLGSVGKAGFAVGLSKVFGLNNDEAEYAFIFSALPTAIYAFAISLVYGDADILAGTTMVSFAVAGVFIYLVLTLAETTDQEQLNEMLNYQADGLLLVSVLALILLFILGLALKRRRRYPDTLIFLLGLLQLGYSYARLACNFVGAKWWNVYVGNYCAAACMTMSVALMVNLILINRLGRTKARNMSPITILIALVLPLGNASLPAANLELDYEQSFGCLFIHDKQWLGLLVGWWGVLLGLIVVSVLVVQRIHRKHPFLPVLTEDHPDEMERALWMHDANVISEHCGSWALTDRFRYQIIAGFQAVLIGISFLAMLGQMITRTHLTNQEPPIPVTILTILSSMTMQVQGLVTWLAMGMRPDALTFYGRFRKLLKTSVAPHRMPAWKDKELQEMRMEIEQNLAPEMAEWRRQSFFGNPRDGDEMSVHSNDSHGGSDVVPAGHRDEMPMRSNIDAVLERQRSIRSPLTADV